jgi:SH3 domain-containing protein
MLTIRKVIMQGRALRLIVTLLTIALFSYSLAGCAGMSPQTKAAIYCGAGGAVVGAAAGTAIDQKNRGIGALIGAIIGAAAGAGACFVIAHYKNREVADYQRTKQQVNYQPSSGDTVSITEYSVSPVSTRPGEKVEFSAEYYVMTPKPDDDITVTETRTIKLYDQASRTYKELGHNTNKITMKPGTRRSDGGFNLNNATPEGKYVLALAVEYNGKRAESEKPLVVSNQPTSVSYQVPEGTKEAVPREPLSPSGEIKQYFIVSVDKTSLRSGAGTQFNILSQLSRGERYPILETIQNPGESYSWYRIRLGDGREGWISGAVGHVE